MTEAAQIILAFIVLVIVFLLAKKFQGMKINRAFIIVIDDLKQQGALSPSAAVTLPYAATSFFRCLLYTSDAVSYTHLTLPTTPYV